MSFKMYEFEPCSIFFLKNVYNQTDVFPKFLDKFRHEKFPRNQLTK